MLIVMPVELSASPPSHANWM